MLPPKSILEMGSSNPLLAVLSQQPPRAISGCPLYMAQVLILLPFTSHYHLPRSNSQQYSCREAFVGTRYRCQGVVVF